MSSVCIALPCGEIGRFSSANGTIANLERPRGSEFVPFMGPSIPHNLNAAAAHFLASTHEWLFLVNDDQIYNPGTLIRLLAHKLPIVTGLTTARTFPFLPAIYGPRQSDGSVRPICLTTGMEGLLPISYCGDHSLLIRRDVLAALQPPYWGAWSEQWTSKDLIQHDVIFCENVRAAGFDLYCDLDTPVGHLAVVPIVPQRDPNGVWTTGVRLSNTDWVQFAAAAPALA